MRLLNRPALEWVDVKQKVQRSLAGVLAILAVLGVTTACDSPTTMLNGIMKMAGLSSAESEELAAEFETACDHFIACAAESAENDEERERFESMAQMCEASGVMVSVISVLGQECQDAAQEYVRCATDKSCEDLTAESGAQTACEAEMNTLKETCERSGREAVGQ